MSSRLKKIEIETVYEEEKEDSDQESSQENDLEESGGGFIESIIFGIGMFFW